MPDQVPCLPPSPSGYIMHAMLEHRGRKCTYFDCGLHKPGRFHGFCGDDRELAWIEPAIGSLFRTHAAFVTLLDD